MPLRRCTAKPGFTLIELLVVVAIIAILAALLVPALATARRRAKNVVCGENLHGIGRAIHTYASEYEGRIPRGPDNISFTGQGLLRDVPHCSVWVGPLGTRNGVGFLVPQYLPNTKHFVCPSDDTTLERMTQNLQAFDDPAGVCFASYLYRNLGQTTNDRVHDLGVNQFNAYANALLMDFLSNTSTEPHLAHALQFANILYRDGSVQQASNAGDAFLFTDADLASGTTTVRRYHQLFITADHAASADPRTAPQVP